MEKTKKVGLLGGTFDPIHLGHLIIAESAYDAQGLDRVVLIPSGHSYFKDHKAKKVLDAQVRLEMTRLAAEGNPHFSVSDIEVRRPGNSYTAETLEELNAAHPDTQYFYIIGADTVMSIETWYRPQDIFSSCVLLAAFRADEVPAGEFYDKIADLKERFGADIRPLPVLNIGISSTEVRERVESGHSIHYLVPDAVERYIMEQGLYC